MRTVTLAQLRLDIQNQADIAGLTQRHGVTLLTRLANQSIQHFREDLSNEGSRHFLTVATGTMQAGATDGFPFKQLNVGALASGVVRVYGVDIKTQGGAWKRLEHTTFEDRTSYGGGHPASIGEPRVWAEYQTTNLAILPPPDRSTDFVVWFLPVLNDLAADTDRFDGVAGWEDYVVWDVTARLMIRDQSPAYQMIVQYRSEAMAKILRSATRVTTAGGATIGRDSMGARGAYRRRGPHGPGDDGRIFDDSFDDSFG
jgi:hypothetical protein